MKNLPCSSALANVQKKTTNVTDKLGKEFISSDTRIKSTCGWVIGKNNRRCQKSRVYRVTKRCVEEAGRTHGSLEFEIFVRVQVKEWKDSHGKWASEQGGGRTVERGSKYNGNENICMEKEWKRYISV